MLARLRQARKSDVLQIAQTYCDALKKLPRGRPSSTWAAIQEEQRIEIEKWMKDNSNHIVVALNEEEKIIGYMHYTKKSYREVHIEGLYTKENKNYAGTRLLSHAVLFAENCDSIISLKSDPSAVEFYKKYGFKESNEYNSYFTDMTLDPKEAYKLKLSPQLAA
jgi:L-amino acid N-acyltransferase YncA